MARQGLDPDGRRESLRLDACEGIGWLILFDDGDQRWVPRLRGPTAQFNSSMFLFVKQNNR